ncbi:MAG TPA: serine hydrolase [Caulobacteraceae bacterium]|jgi:CubicO group peptidase (beta-lactamase class C family)
MRRFRSPTWFFLAAALLPALGRADSAPSPGASILAWTPAQQAYGYRNMESLRPTATVKHGRRVRPLPMATNQIAPIFSFGGKDFNLDSYMAAYRVSGVIAIKDGRIILERYGLGRLPRDRWTSFSVAKSITSTLIGAAIQDGRIGSLDDPVVKYIPQLAGAAYDGVTIRQLITMTSGAKWNEDYSDLNSDVAKVGLTAVGNDGVNPVVGYMRHLARDAAPGTRFHYNTGETDLAGILVTNAVGMSMADYLSQKIWKPFGMEADAAWVEDMAGHERGGCCISMTLRDYARFGLFLLEGGRAGDRAVLPEDWVVDATRAHVREPRFGYGYFWWIYPDRFEAEGIFGQAIAVFPHDHLVVAINSAWPRADDNMDWAAQAAFLEAVKTAAAGHSQAH